MVKGNLTIKRRPRVVKEEDDELAVRVHLVLCDLQNVPHYLPTKELLVFISKFSQLLNTSMPGSGFRAQCRE